MNFPVVFKGFQQFWRIFLLFLKDFQNVRQQLLKKLLTNFCRFAAKLLKNTFLSKKSCLKKTLLAGNSIYTILQKPRKHILVLVHADLVFELR